jgi:hypothetical protein
MQNAQTLSVIVRGKLDAIGVSQTLARRFITTTAKRVWSFSLISTNKMRFQAFVDGTTASTADSTNTPTLVVGTEYWFRVDYTASTRATSFYLSTDGSTWTQQGATVTGSTSATAMYVADSPVEAGAASGGFLGRLRSITVASSFGGTVLASQDFGSATYWHDGDGTGATSTDAQGNVWTLAGAALTAVDGWIADSRGLAGAAFGQPTGARYLGGMAYPTPAKGELLHLIRETAGVWTLEKHSKASGSWASRILATAANKLGRPRSIVGGGPLETVYSDISAYVDYNSYAADAKGI